MLMNDKIIFDRYYCINSAKKKELMMYYILQPHHVFIGRVKVFILMFVPARLQLLIISMCFAWCPVTSINKSHVLTGHTRELLYQCFITRPPSSPCCLQILKLI